MAAFLQVTMHTTFAAVWATIDAHILANGWTAYDILSTVAGSRDVVYRGGELVLGSGIRPFVRMKQVAGPAVAWRGYSDWDAVAHTGMNECSPGDSARLLFPGDGNFMQVWGRVNPQAMLWTKSAAFTGSDWVYAGFLQRRMIAAATAGVTTAREGLDSGRDNIPTAQSMVGKVTIGQYVQVTNYAHEASSPNKNHSEMVRVTGVEVGQLDIDPLVNDYDPEAIVGLLSYPLVVFSSRDGYGWSPFSPSGFRESANGMRMFMTSSLGGGQLPLGSDFAYDNPNTFEGGFYQSGRFPLRHQQVAGSPDQGYGGCMFHVLSSNQANNALWKIADSLLNINGERYWCLCGVGSQLIGIGNFVNFTPGVIAVGPGGLTDPGGSSWKVAFDGAADTDDGAPAPVIPDSVAPSIAILSPPSGAEIGTNDEIRLSVTDVGGLRRAALLARFIGASTYDVVFDGLAFGPNYEQASRQLVIANGFEFRVKRRGGWPLGDVQWKVLAFDTSGNEA